MIDNDTKERILNYLKDGLSVRYNSRYNPNQRQHCECCGVDFPKKHKPHCELFNLIQILKNIKES